MNRQLFLIVGDVKIAITNDKGQEVPFQIQDNENGTFTVDYTPANPGNHKVLTMLHFRLEYYFKIIYQMSRSKYAVALLYHFQVSVLYAGREIPGSPIKVAVQPRVDVSKVKVNGLEPSMFRVLNYFRTYR